MNTIKSPEGAERDVFKTLTERKEGAVLFAEIAAPPMNLLGPEPPLHSITSSARAWTSTHGLLPAADAGCRAWEYRRHNLRRVPFQPPRPVHTR
jgi:hypothetical protein